jgi:predicted RNA-binding Zn-ribbon protein involved in translation (DUF1610 family)
MIIYGTRSKQLAKEHVTDKCPNCGAQNSIDMYVFQKYGHIFWIPFVPMEKTGVSECTQCKQVLQILQMPANLISAFVNVKAKTKTPLWTFAGLAALGILIIIVVFEIKKDKELNAKLVLTPQAGDIYEVKTKEDNYTLMKIIRVQGDSVYVNFNNYETDKASGIYQLKEKEYSEDVSGLSKMDLREMFKDGNIYDIERN